MVKETPLSEVHKKLGAKMIDFAGWKMPVEYTSIIDEHITTRTKAGLFDICHMGELEVSGDGALDFIQTVITNDAEKLEVGKVLYTCMCYENGTTIDDLCVFKVAEDRYMLVVNAANTEKDFDWLTKNKVEGVEIRDIKDKIAKIDIQGPESEKILQRLTNTKLGSIKRFHFLYANVDNVRALISRTGYTGEVGFELFFDPKFAVQLWNKLMEVGKPEGIKPIGLGARDTLRIEACYSLYGHELDETITPVEAGLGWLVKEYKNFFFGKEVLARQKIDGVKRKIVAFEMVDRAIPREGYLIEKGGRIGYVTSGTYSPTFKKGMGMGLVSVEHADVGQTIKIVIRNKRYNALVVKGPFYPYRGPK